LVKRILSFELEGKLVLGFDTGLDARSFAQTKMSLFITQPGYIVCPAGNIETWQPEGVTERANTMIIWGSHFPGEELAEVINRKDEAMDALRYWLRARIIIEENSGSGKEPPLPGPAGAFIVTTRQAANPGSVNQGSANSFPSGTVFFPPARLLKRTLDAAGGLSPGVGSLNAQRWTHPDLKGNDGISFCAGVMLYYIFCSIPPFSQKEENDLRQDIREGVFVPSDLAAPGLDPEMAKLITEAISPIPKPNEAKSRPAPDCISDFIGPPLSKPASSWVKDLSEKEISESRAKHEQYNKRKTLAVKRQRFLTRNAKIIIVCSIAFLALTFFIQNMAQARAELPTTRGMVPIEVVEAYYNAFNALDHSMMQACVIGRAGSDDIRMITSLFVISRVRYAHETNPFFMSADEWVAAGSPVTDKIVFGITDLTIRVLSESETNVILEADYILWTQSANEEENQAGLPLSLVTKDILRLVLHRDAWRISSIERTH